MTIDPRTPVVVGVGQCNQRSTPADARTPVELFADAATLAGDDAGHGLLGRTDTVATVQITSWPYADPSAAVAVEVRFDVENARSVVLTIDGREIGDLDVGASVRCTGARRPARIATLGPRDFHQVLKAKFGLPDR